jgi:hypothetical protein
MDVARFVLGAVVFLGFAVPTAFAQTDKEVAMEAAKGGAVKPWKHVRGFGRVLNLTKLPVVIDEPGLYAIDRNWRLEQPGGVFELIQITADEVTLDLHGFEILADPGQGTLLVITGGFAEVRNGELSACCTDGGVAVQATRAARLHHLSIFSYDAMTFEGGTSLTDSEIVPRVGMSFDSFAVLERNVIRCNFACVTLLGDDNRLLNNTVIPWQGGVIDVLGDRNIVANTVVDATNSVDIDDPFQIAGDRNVVRDNTVLIGGDLNHVFTISGTANTLDGNIASPPVPGGRAPVGMQFTASGNYYGDNRMAAVVPFAFDGTVQTNWGGNVGY